MYNAAWKTIWDRAVVQQLQTSSIKHFNCIVDVDECIQSPCGQNATCRNFPGSYDCFCNEGFEGNGLQCSGIPSESAILSLHLSECKMTEVLTLDIKEFIAMKRVIEARLTFL